MIVEPVLFQEHKCLCPGNWCREQMCAVLHQQTVRQQAQAVQQEEQEEALPPSSFLSNSTANRIPGLDATFLAQSDKVCTPACCPGP